MHACISFGSNNYADSCLGKYLVSFIIPCAHSSLCRRSVVLYVTNFHFLEVLNHPEIVGRLFSVLPFFIKWD